MVQLGATGANVLVIDYRGFGDSEGTPTEEGVNLDARTSWQWLVDNGANPRDIVVMGHSLGTGIATKLVTQLQSEGTLFSANFRHWCLRAHLENSDRCRTSSSSRSCSVLVHRGDV